MANPQGNPTSEAPPAAKSPNTGRLDIISSAIMGAVIGAVDGRTLGSEVTEAVQDDGLLEYFILQIVVVFLIAIGVLVPLNLAKALWARYVEKRRFAWREVAWNAWFWLLLGVIFFSLSLAAWLVGGWPTGAAGMWAGGAVGLGCGLVIGWWESRAARAAKRQKDGA